MNKFLHILFFTTLILNAATCPMDFYDKLMPEEESMTDFLNSNDYKDEIQEDTLSEITDLWKEKLMTNVLEINDKNNETHNIDNKENQPPCKYCKKVLKSQASLYNHENYYCSQALKLGYITKNLTCPYEYCGFKFCRKNDLNGHIKRKHLKPLVIKPLLNNKEFKPKKSKVGENPKKFCKHCYKGVSDAGSLYNHEQYYCPKALKLGYIKKDLVCFYENCEKTFSRQYDLNTHVKNKHLKSLINHE